MLYHCACGQMFCFTLEIGARAVRPLRQEIIGARAVRPLRILWTMFHSVLWLLPELFAHCCCVILLCTELYRPILYALLNIIVDRYYFVLMNL